MDEEKRIDLQVSSTTLGYEGDGGSIGAALALGEGIISKEAYTETVVTNAEKFKQETEKIFPSAQFGVSVLASSINPEKMKDLIGSVDYPYVINWGLDFIKEKKQKVQNEGRRGFGGMVDLAQELGYAMLQSDSDRSQIRDTVNVSNSSYLNPVMIRTCIETISFENEIKKIKEINSRLNKDAIWVIEPNKKVGDGTYASFLQTYENILKAIPDINFGIDLDLGGLPKEDNLLSVLDNMNSNNMLPLLISLSGKEYIDGDVRTHLPLGGNSIENRELAQYLYRMQLRGQKIPGLVIESSPALRNSLGDYTQFLDSFKRGFLL
jgi:hypothetical protein